MSAPGNSTVLTSLTGLYPAALKSGDSETCTLQGHVLGATYRNIACVGVTSTERFRMLYAGPSGRPLLFGGVTVTGAVTLLLTAIADTLVVVVAAVTPVESEKYSERDSPGRTVTDNGKETRSGRELTSRTRYPDAGAAPSSSIKL